MRLGGRVSGQKDRFIARTVVITAVLFFGVGLAGNAGASDQTAHMWAVTRDSAGHLHVVRGMDAAVASMDNQLGRMSSTVLSYERDSTVKALGTNDPYYNSQYALKMVKYESVWGITRGSGVTVAVIDTGVLG